MNTKTNNKATETDRMRLFTFRLIDARHVTYGGLTEKHAFNRAREYHGDAVAQEVGKPAERCSCSGSKCAESTRQAGWLICRDCAGYFG